MAHHLYFSSSLNFAVSVMKMKSVTAPCRDCFQLLHNLPIMITGNHNNFGVRLQFGQKCRTHTYCSAVMHYIPKQD